MLESHTCPADSIEIGFGEDITSAGSTILSKSTRDVVICILIEPYAFRCLLDGIMECGAALYFLITFWIATNSKMFNKGEKKHDLFTERKRKKNNLKIKP